MRREWLFLIRHYFIWALTLLPLPFVFVLSCELHCVFLQVRDLFNEYDDSHDGSLDLEEFKQLMAHQL